jgi:hypothetical protein
MPSVNLIVFEGEVCSITFQDETIRFTTRVGHRHFARLVRLEGAVHGADLVAADRNQGGLEVTGQGHDKGFRSQGSVGERIDRETVRQYTERLAKLPRLIEDAELFGEWEDAIALRAEKAELERILRIDVDHRGNPRIDGDRRRQDADAARNAFNRLLDLFRRKHRGLYVYVRDRLVMEGAWFGFERRPGDAVWEVSGSWGS